MLYPPHQKKEGNFRKRPVFFLEKEHFCVQPKKSKTPWTSHLEDHQTPPSAPPPKVSWTIRMWIRFGGMKRGCLSWKKCTRYCWWFRNPKEPPNMYASLLTMGYNLPYQLVSRISSINSMSSEQHLVFLFHGNLRLTPWMLTTPRMREWKGTMMLAKSPNKTGVIKLPIWGGSNNANVWWFWRISPIMVHCLGW